MDGDAGEYLEAIILGVVQALTEFLPVSSSGHLVLAPHILGRETSSLTFDVGLHLGTTAAVLGYFWRDWVAIVRSALGDLVSQRASLGRWSPQGRLGLWLVVGTVPAALVGLLFEDWIDENVRAPWVVGVMLIVFGLLLGAADRWGAQVGRLLDMSAGRSFLIGCAQAVALIPGVSRSGATITAGRALGFDRVSAARFSFLLSAPIILGAGILQMLEVLSGEEDVSWGPLFAGAATSAVVGALVIGAFMRFISRRTMAVFVWYRIALGLVVLAVAAGGGW